jgi:hypothetical protein
MRRELRIKQITKDSIFRGFVVHRLLRSAIMREDLGERLEMHRDAPVHLGRVPGLERRDDDLQIGAGRKRD